MKSSFHHRHYSHFANPPRFYEDPIQHRPFETIQGCFSIRLKYLLPLHRFLQMVHANMYYLIAKHQVFFRVPHQ